MLLLLTTIIENVGTIIKYICICIDTGNSNFNGFIHTSKRIHRNSINVSNVNYMVSENIQDYLSSMMHIRLHSKLIHPLYKSYELCLFWPLEICHKLEIKVLMLVYLTIQNGFPALPHSHSLNIYISISLSPNLSLIFSMPSSFSNMTQFLNKHNRIIYTKTRFFSKEKFTTTIEYLHGNLNEHNLIFFTAKAFVNIYSSLKL